MTLFQHFLRLSRAVVLVLVVGPAISSWAQQPRQGVLRGSIVNGTTGEPGLAKKVTLIDITSGMQPLASLNDVNGNFTLENFEVESGKTYLLQVSFDGVIYNSHVDFGQESEVETSLTVYDVTRDWTDIEITTARHLLRRANDRLRVDKLYRVENKTSPPRTLYDMEGSFRFNVPTELERTPAVSSHSASSTMPVSQSAFPLADGSGDYFITTAFKPGLTDITVSYDVDYSEERYLFREKITHPLSELLILVAPLDVRLDSEGWEILGPEPEGRFTVLRRPGLASGDQVELELSGGSEYAQGMAAAGSGNGASSRAQVTKLPDPTRFHKWVVVLLMGVALTYGLMSALGSVPASSREGPAGREDLSSGGNTAGERSSRRDKN